MFPKSQGDVFEIAYFLDQQSKVQIVQINVSVLSTKTKTFLNDTQSWNKDFCFKHDFDE